MSRLRLLLPTAVACAAACAAACAGPPAPDAAICRDVVHRLCIAPRCPSVERAIDAGVRCEEVTLERTGCSSDDFTFGAPPRERVLECRLPLLRKGLHPEQQPACEDVDESLERCPDLQRFLQGVR